MNNSRLRKVLENLTRNSLCDAAGMTHTKGNEFLLLCCFTFTETVGLLGTGAQDIHLDFHTAPELCGKETHSLT